MQIFNANVWFSGILDKLENYELKFYFLSSLQACLKCHALHTTCTATSSLGSRVATRPVIIVLLSIS